MSEQFRAGDEVIATEDFESYDSRGRKGDAFIVEDYVSADEADDGEAFYWLSAHGGYNNYTASPDVLRPGRTRDELKSRRIPSIEDVARYVAQTGSSNSFDIDETDFNDPEQIEFYGTTVEGLPFGFGVKVLWVAESDF